MKMNRVKNVLFALGCLAWVSNCHAEWNPSYLVKLELLNRTHLHVLKDKNYVTVKQNVLSTLANSWCSQEKGELIMDLIVLYRPKTCVEIGVFAGDTILPTAVALKYLGEGKVYAIDAWSNHEATKNMDDQDPNKSWWVELNFKSVYNSFQTVLKKWSLAPYCHVLHFSSKNAVNYVNDIDFLHMDGDFTTRGSMLDVELYLPKVKIGGYILFSNLYLSVNDKQPKMNAFSKLLDYCEIVCEVDHNNTVLLRKITN